MGLGAGKAWAIDFGPAEIVEANGVEIVVPGHSMPSLPDWNNDLLADLNADGVLDYSDLAAFVDLMLAANE